MNSTSAQSPQDALDYFRSRRHEMALLPQGFLALVNTHWFYGKPGEPESVWMAPGKWAALESTQQGIELWAEAPDEIMVDGERVVGRTIVTGKDSDKASEIVFNATQSATVIKGEDGTYALRVWDSHSEDIQKFGSIDSYGYNPEWVITGTFTPIDGGRNVEMSHLKDQGVAREKVIPGDIRFTFDGVEYTPSAYLEGRALMIVFSDATSGTDTYSVGRFLMVAPNPDGSITLDFNRAYLPPCAFSYNFNCPMPPQENRFPFAVTAGEKNVLNKEGGLLH